MKIKKKYDVVMFLLYSIIYAICLFMIIYPFAVMKRYKISFLDIVFMIVAIFVLAYFIYAYVHISYSMDDKHLTIVAGFNKVTLKLKDIIGVRTCRKYFSSTITSIKCVEIRYSPYGRKADSRCFYLSVKDQEKLIEELKSKCKKLA